MTDVAEACLGDVAPACAGDGDVNVDDLLAVACLSDAVAVAFAAGRAEARITAPDGDIVTFISEHAYNPIS
jgi:hypothetical protein